jgi:uncharacterized protein (DUF1697 family)
MKKYVAFLRGINVGGKTIKMDKLKGLFESLGFKNVKTILNSGNVIFEAPAKDTETLTRRIEDALSKAFSFEIDVVLRTYEQIIPLIESMPFKSVKVTSDTRLYVTFISDADKHELKMPYTPKEMSFKVIALKDGSIFSVLTLSPNTGTVDLMDFLSKEFGKKITTRNWNTIEKVRKALE